MNLLLPAVSSLLILLALSSLEVKAQEPAPPEAGSIVPIPRFTPLELPEKSASQDSPKESPPLFGPSARPRAWPDVWGFGGILAATGDKMAPNGVTYDPLFDLQAQLNFGLLADKKLYVYFDMDFWGQAAGAGVTNPNQGSFDYSKREWDFDLGLAWNYYGALELRVFGYAQNNLNRGTSLASPYGYNDGGGLENRYYFNNADKYDVGKLSFLSIGYLAPSSTLIGQDGLQFHPGLTARAYLTHDLPMLCSYLYLDGQFIADKDLAPRLLLYDAGLAVRPFPTLQNLEFRVGGSGVYDIQYNYDRSLGYVGIRLQF